MFDLSESERFSQFNCKEQAPAKPPAPVLDRGPYIHVSLRGPRELDKLTETCSKIPWNFFEEIRGPFF